MSVVLGIDPGSKFTGYGLVAKDRTGFRLVQANRIATDPSAPLPKRLHQVYQGLQEVIHRYDPDAVAVEDIFFAKNVRSAVRLGHVRGVVLLAAAEAGLPVYEYSPAAIKMAAVGYGRADKRQVGLMVKQLLRIREELAEDTSDALATAICHLNRTPQLTGAAS